MVALTLPFLALQVVFLLEFWDASDWQPLWLVLVLAVVIVAGELYAVRIGSVYVSSTSCALLLALALLGPAPAVVIATGSVALDWHVNRKSMLGGLANVVIAATATLTGALTIEAVAGPDPAAADDGLFAAAVLLGGIAMAAANILLLGGYRRLQHAEPFRAAFMRMYLPTLPYHVLGMTLAAGAAQLIVADGVPESAAVITVLLLSEFLLRSLAADRYRVDEVMTLTEERANLLEQALTAEVAERGRIAGHLHDETLQTLAAARQELEDVGNSPSAAIARRHLDSAVAELRSTLAHVHPGSVARHGLATALETYASQAFRHTGVTWSVVVAPGIGREHDRLLYPLARELLCNAAKHARATTVEVVVCRDRDRLRLTVRDDGVGMARGAAEQPGHFGLLTARHRVSAAGGSMTVTDDRGTHVAIELPFAR